MKFKFVIEVYKMPNCYNAACAHFPEWVATGKTMKEAVDAFVLVLEDGIPDYLANGGHLPDEVHATEIVEVAVPSTALAGV